MKAFFSSELYLLAPLHFPPAPALSQRRPADHTGGPAPFHTFTVFEICLNGSLLPSPALLFAADKCPSRRKGGTPAHTLLAGVDSIFRDGVWGSEVRARSNRQVLLKCLRTQNPHGEIPL